ncbi:MAG TPA: hypothetical protein VK925_02425 [Jiangellaceae bacterium]|nr:hypothetical protein [Jiangellaceae bacterium]
MRPRCRLLDVLQAQDLGRPVRVLDDGLHRSGRRGSQLVGPGARTPLVTRSAIIQNSATVGAV